jgi:hypothetical protein
MSSPGRCQQRAAGALGVRIAAVKAVVVEQQHGDGVGKRLLEEVDVAHRMPHSRKVLQQGRGHRAELLDTFDLCSILQVFTQPAFHLSHQLGRGHPVIGARSHAAHASSCSFTGSA